MNELKFAGIPLGTFIRAYDFQTIEGRPEAFVEGHIVADFINSNHVAVYAIHVTKDSCEHGSSNGAQWNSRVDEEIHVPHQVSMMEWDGRIQVLTEVDSQFADENVDTIDDSTYAGY